MSAGDGAAIVRAEAEDADQEGSDNAEKNHAQLAQKAEDRLVKGVITTDLILSCEIMLIAFNSVLDHPLLNRILIMIAVAIIITAGVYGVLLSLLIWKPFLLSLCIWRMGVRGWLFICTLLGCAGLGEGAYCVILRWDFIIKLPKAFYIYNSGKIIVQIHTVSDHNYSNALFI